MAYTALRRAAASPLVRTAYFAVIALGATWSALRNANQLNIYQDAQHFTLFEEAARIAVAKFHELPLWDPYYCGGIAGLGTPSARFVSPTFLLSLAFGTLRGATLATFVMTMVGLEGTFRYARARGAGALGAMTAAPVFALSGVFAHATLVAWTNFFSFELVPWALLGIHRALRGERRGLVVATLSLGWMVGFGGTYTAPLTALAAAFEAIEMLVSMARRPKPARRILTAAILGLVLVALTVSVSMVRLWPIAETLSSSPRLLGGKPGTDPIWVWRFLFGERSNRWMRADFLIGLPVLPLVAFGVWRKRSIGPAIGIALWVWFALGYKVHRSLFAALRTIPPYTMLRAPERFLVFVALAASLIAALGIRRLEAAFRKTPKYVALALLFHGLLIGDTVLLARLGQTKAADRKMDPEPPVAFRDFRQTRGNRWIAAYYPMMSRGSLTCFDDYDIAQSSSLRSDLPQEEYLKDTAAGTVKRLAWSPNRIDLQVNLTRPARVYVNQNWHPGWRSNEGAVVAEDGLLSVDLPAGSRALTLRFQPRSAMAGMTTTILALLVLGAMAWLARTRRTVELGRDLAGTVLLSIAPLLVVPLSFTFLREPRRPAPPLLTQAGEPMAVDAPPEDATPLGVRWAEGITLEAAHVEVEPKDDAHGTMATLELDWRFDRPLPPGLGIFVQFERSGGRFGTDHVLLSGVLLPEDAPLHTTLRDVAEPFALPDSKPDTKWNVYAGFWRARRDMTRLKVVNHGSATINANRVLVGTFVAEPSTNPPPP